MVPPETEQWRGYLLLGARSETERSRTPRATKIRRRPSLTPQVRCREGRRALRSQHHETVSKCHRDDLSGRIDERPTFVVVKRDARPSPTEAQENRLFLDPPRLLAIVCASLSPELSVSAHPHGGRRGALRVRRVGVPDAQSKQVPAMRRVLLRPDAHEAVLDPLQQHVDPPAAKVPALRLGHVSVTVCLAEIADGEWRGVDRCACLRESRSTTRDRRIAPSSLSPPPSPNAPAALRSSGRRKRRCSDDSIPLGSRW